MSDVVGRPLHVRACACVCGGVAAVLAMNTRVNAPTQRNSTLNAVGWGGWVWVGG